MSQPMHSLRRLTVIGAVVASVLALSPTAAGADFSRDGLYEIRSNSPVAANQCVDLESQQNSSSRIVIADCLDNRASQLWNRDTGNLRLKTVSGLTDRCITVFTDNDGALALRLAACGGENTEQQKFKHLGGNLDNKTSTPERMKFHGDPLPNNLCWSAPDIGTTERRILLVACANSHDELLQNPDQVWSWTLLTP